MAAGCEGTSRARARSAGRDAFSRDACRRLLTRSLAIAAGVAALVVPAGTAAAGVRQPFDTPVALPSGAGLSAAAVSVAPGGTIDVLGQSSQGSGCALFTLGHSGATARFLGRTPGGAGCALARDSTPTGLALGSRSADGSVSGASANGSTFTYADQAGPAALGAMAADPVANATGSTDVYQLEADPGTGLPRVALSEDGGQTYALGSALITADVPAAQWQGTGPAPVTGNLVARRDATGLRLYSVFLTADSGPDRAAQAKAGTDRLNRVYEALGTVTPGVTPGAPPAVTWRDVEVWHAPPGTQLNNPAPAIAVDSAGHVYVALADGPHVDVTSSFDGLSWNAAAAPQHIDTLAAGLPQGVLDAAVAPALAAGGNGKVDVAWLGATHDTWTVFLAQTVDQAASWTAYPVSGSAPVHQGPAPGGVALAVDQVTGAAAVAYDADVASGVASLFATRQCTGLSAVTGVALVDDCVASQPATPVLPGSTCPGPQVTDPAADAIDNSVSGKGRNVAPLDLLTAQISTADPRTLLATITLNRLTSSLPAGVAQAAWQLTWMQGGVERYARATLTGHAPAFTVGTVAADGMLQRGSAVHGAFSPGAGGTITMDVPVKALGNPAPGTPLQDIVAATYVRHVSSADSTVQPLDRAPDGGSGAPISVAQLCAPEDSMPEVPAAVMLPAAAALVGMVFLWRRRRRGNRTPAA